MERFDRINEELCDSLLKELMAYFTLYMVARPWAEQHAWTVNLRTPAVANLFVTGSSLTESVVGRVFTQDIKEPEENTLYSTQEEMEKLQQFTEQVNRNIKEYTNS